MKFTLDTTLPDVINVTSADAAAGHPFAEAGFAAGGVASIYGVLERLVDVPDLSETWRHWAARAITRQPSPTAE
jgi:hypothetical protein